MTLLVALDVVPMVAWAMDVNRSVLMAMKARYSLTSVFVTHVTSAQAVTVNAATMVTATVAFAHAMTTGAARSAIFQAVWELVSTAVVMDNVIQLLEFAHATLATAVLAVRVPIVQVNLIATASVSVTPLMFRQCV